METDSERRRLCSAKFGSQFVCIGNRRKPCCLAPNSVKVKQRAPAGCARMCNTWLCPGGVVHRSLLTLFKVCTLKKSFKIPDLKGNRLLSVSLSESLPNWITNCVLYCSYRPLVVFHLAPHLPDQPEPPISSRNSKPGVYSRGFEGVQLNHPFSVGASKFVYSLYSRTRPSVFAALKKIIRMVVVDCCQRSFMALQYISVLIFIYYCSLLLFTHCCYAHCVTCSPPLWPLS